MQGAWSPGSCRQQLWSVARRRVGVASSTPFHLSPAVMGVGRSVPGEGTRGRAGAGIGPRPGPTHLEGRGRSELCKRREEDWNPVLLEHAHPTLVSCARPYRAMGKQPARVHISTRDPVPAQSDFLALTQNFFFPRPPKPFSEDSLSMAPSPSYLVCSPSSPPPGQPGRYRCRHLGSGRRGGA